MNVDIRVTRPEEYEAAARVKSIALLQTPIAGDAFHKERASWEESQSLSAWDDNECVGNASLFTVETTVPGGARLPSGALTRVGVLPTHRRQRIGRRLLENMMMSAADQGLAMVSLRASEATIYQRYGFGLAGESCGIKVNSRSAKPIVGAAPGGTFRLLNSGEVRETVMAVFDRVGRRRHGAISRVNTWWDRAIRPAIDSTAASFIVVHINNAGEIDGYVHYDVTWPDTAGDDSVGHGQVHDLFGASDDIELALWEYLINADLVTSWSSQRRPLDLLLRAAVRDPRAVQTTSIDDEQWLRLVDVDRSLRARTYSDNADSVVIEVSDSLLPTNCGRWRIGPHGAVQVDDPPDIMVPVSALSAAYLGGRAWRTLSKTKEVEVRRAAALPAIDRLFAVDEAPFCGTFF